MRPSKIEEYHLQQEFLKQWNLNNRKYQRTADALTSVSGIKFNKQNIMSYVKKLNKNSDNKITTQSESQHEIKKFLVDEKDKVMQMYQFVIQKAMEPLQNADTDEEILRAVPVTMKTLDRALTQHGIGVMPQIQINQQFNTVFVDKICEILVDELNGDARRIIERIKSVDIHGQ